MKMIKHIKKPIFIGAVVLMLSALSVMGAVMSYYMQTTVNIGTDAVLEYSLDDITYQKCEDLGKTYDFVNFTGDNIEVQQFHIKASPHLQKNVPVEFTITDISTNDPDGMTLALQYDDSGTWTDIFNWSATQSGTTSGTFIFPPNHKENFRLWVEGHYYLMEGDHSFTIDLEYDEP